MCERKHSATIKGRWLLRKYTPTSPMTKTGSFDLVVKVYPEGRMSRMLDEIPIGRAITVRGPQGHYDHPEADAEKDLVMIAGGVGITTCFQFFQSAFNNEIHPRSIHLLYSSRFEDEIVFTNELKALQEQNPDRFHVHFTITRVCVSPFSFSSHTTHVTSLTRIIASPFGCAAFRGMAGIERTHRRANVAKVDASHRSHNQDVCLRR